MSYKPSSTSLEDIKKELESVLPLNKDLDTYIHKEVMRQKITAIAYRILNKTESHINFFEPLENLFIN
jgi:hypothetical protein